MEVQQPHPQTSYQGRLTLTAQSSPMNKAAQLPWQNKIFTKSSSVKSMQAFNKDSGRSSCKRPLTIAVAPRLHSAQRASLRKFVSNEDLAIIDMEKKLATQAINQTEGRAPRLNTLERARQRERYGGVPLNTDDPFKPVERRPMIEIAASPSNHMKAENIVDHQAPFNNFYKQKKVLEAMYIPSIFNDTKGRHPMMSKTGMARSQQNFQLDEEGQTEWQKTMNIQAACVQRLH